MTFVLEPDGAPRGGVLLLHGLTDSPYSLRSLGTVLVADGWRVVGLRLPGHGTAPSGLLRFEPDDLRAVLNRLVKAGAIRREGEGPDTVYQVLSSVAAAPVA